MPGTVPSLKCVLLGECNETVTDGSKPLKWWDLHGQDLHMNWHWTLIYLAYRFFRRSLMAVPDNCRTSRNMVRRRTGWHPCGEYVCRVIPCGDLADFLVHMTAGGPQ